jgi:alpha-1,3-mannosyl-glycoprotein beta-1,2-N-acetylglucosaminyltransferase
LSFLADAGLSEPIAVLVFACNRSTAIKNHLDQLIKLRPSKDKFPIIVSQDCEHEETTRVIQSYGTQLTLIHQPDQREIVLEKKMQKFLGYYKIARHYRWALNETFFTFQYKSVIVTEGWRTHAFRAHTFLDDLDLAVDFFEYFTATHKLLERDKTLMCVSAWNDNGKPDLIEDKPEMLWRTDFFPGLG